MSTSCTTRQGRRLILCLLLALAFAQPGGIGAAGDQTTRVKLNFPKVDVRELLSFYSRLTKRPVLADVALQAAVTVDVAQELSVEEAEGLIRKTLLESYGIEMRESDRGETLVTWSKDPKHPPHSDLPWTEAQRRVLHGRVQVVQPTQ